MFSMIVPVIHTFIVTFIIILAIFLLKRWRQGKIAKEPNYRTLFILGVAFIPLGLWMDNDVFFVVGIVFLIMGIANVEKWKDTFASSKKVGEKAKKIKRIGKKGKK